jgi:hypothetical protein
VAIWLRRSLVVAADGREMQTVGGRARPEKVLSRMLTLFGDSMSASICFGASIFLGLMAVVLRVKVLLSAQRPS